MFHGLGCTLGAKGIVGYSFHRRRVHCSLLDLGFVGIGPGGARRKVRVRDVDYPRRGCRRTPHGRPDTGIWADFPLGCREGYVDRRRTWGFFIDALGLFCCGEGSLGSH